MSGRGGGGEGARRHYYFLNRKLHLFVNVTAYLEKQQRQHNDRRSWARTQNPKHKYKTNSNTLSANENVIREQN